MRARSLVALGASITAAILALVACASDEDGDLAAPDAQAKIPSMDSGAEAEAAPEDAAAEEPCLPDALCPNGPFDPSTPVGGLDLRTRINVIRGRSATDVWAAGARGAIAHFDGASWTVSETGSKESMIALWLRDSGEVAAASLQSFYTRGLPVPDGGDAAAPASAGGWTPIQPPGPPTVAVSVKHLTSAWMTSSAEWLWFTTMEVRPSSGTNPHNGLWRVHVSEETTSLEIADALPQGTCQVVGCLSMTSIHGVSADDLWAVGYRGAAVHIEGAQSATPKVTPFDTQTWSGLNGVWVASENDAWAVGGAGIIRHYTGQPVSWDIVSDVPATEDLRAVWGTSSSDVWVVGDAATVLHWDGASWSRVKVTGLGARRPNLYAVWTPAPGHVWVGGDGVLLSLGGKP